MSRSLPLLLLLLLAILPRDVASWEWTEMVDGYSEMNDYSRGASYVDAEGRVGTLTALSTSGNNINYTFNLSGIILLGLGIASSLMFAYYLDATDSRRSLSKRDADDAPPSLCQLMSRIEEDAAILSLMEGGDRTCYRQLICQTVYWKNSHKYEEGTLGDYIMTITEYTTETDFPNSVGSSDMTEKLQEFILASNLGTSPSNCRRHYPCDRLSDTDIIPTLLHTL